MTTSTTLRLLDKTNNARGDLFTRLVGDLFFALGYVDLIYDVQKPGSEIDIQGAHRFEPRRMVAECKAHIDKMGGADLNKLLGIATRERGKHKPTPVTAYFVSLSGFRQTGIEQELQTDEQDRIILLDGQNVIDELIRMRFIVSKEVACERAGRCAANSVPTDAVIEGTELLGHPLGYLWVVYYSQGKQRTNFALIHADGTPLATSVASEVIQADRDAGGTLHSLKYLSPPAHKLEQDVSAKATFERYLPWVVKECGNIQLEGLLADGNLSEFSMKLEQSPHFTEEVAAILVDWLRSSDRLIQTLAAVVCIHLAFSNAISAENVCDAHSASWKLIGDALAPLLAINDPPLALVASWAMAWIRGAKLTKTPPTSDVVLSLFRLRRKAESIEQRRVAA